MSSTQSSAKPSPAPTEERGASRLIPCLYPSYRVLALDLVIELVHPRAESKLGALFHHEARLRAFELLHLRSIFFRLVEVANEDDARLVGQVPRRVWVRRIEDEQLAFAPLDGLVSNLERDVPLGNDEPEM